MLIAATLDVLGEVDERESGELLAGSVAQLTEREVIHMTCWNIFHEYFLNKQPRMILEANKP